MEGESIWMNYEEKQGARRSKDKKKEMKEKVNNQ